MTETTLKQKTAKGLFWGGISSGAQQLLGVAFGIYLARMLTADDYGLIGMLAIFTGIVNTIINSGFSIALINKKDASEKDYNAVFWFSFFMGLSLYIILFFCAPSIARFYERPELTLISRVLFIGFFLGCIGLVPYTIMSKQLKVKEQSIINIIAILISGITGIFLAFKGFAYWALVAQNALYSSLLSIQAYIISPWKPTFYINFHPLKKLFSFSVKLFITNIFVQISGNFLSVLVGKLYNATQLGYYTQGQKWMGMGNMFIGGMISSVAQPILVQVNEEKERQVNVFRKMIRFGAFISFPLMLGLAFVSREFILITIREKWLPSIPFLQLFCIWGAFAYLSALFTNLIYTHGKSNIYMYITIAIGLLQLLTVVLLHRLGIFSMVIGYLFVYFISLFVWQYYVRRLIGLRLRDTLRDISPYLFITLVCFLITWFLTKNIINLYLLLISKIIISGILYLLILKMSNSTIFKESMNFLFMKKNRSVMK